MPTDAEIFPNEAALAQAARKGDTSMVAELVKNGANPNAQGDRSVNLLQWAVYHKSARGLVALLEAGADPSIGDARGETVMHLAAMAKDVTYLLTLLAAGVDPNTPNTITQASPLAAAIMGNRDQQRDALLAAGADVNQADRLGNTPLHIAAKLDAYSVVLRLLDAGADPHAINSQAATFLGYMKPAERLNPEARAQQEAVRHWLAAHGVTVSEPHVPRDVPLTRQ